MQTISTSVSAKKNARTVLWAFFLPLLLAACGGGDDNTDETISAEARVVGINVRPDNTACTAPPRPAARTTVTLTRMFDSLAFDKPVGLLQAPGDDSRWFVLEQTLGRVQTFASRPDVNQSETFVDLSDRVYNKGEDGLLSMAFHPRYPDTPEAFISYTRRGAPTVSYISRFTSPDGGRTLDPSSEQVLLTLDQPSIIHQGGHLAFGPDGYLYIGFGDGGPPGYPDITTPDPFGHGQNPATLFGAMLRIDVDGGAPYAIPPDNPFVDGSGGAPEVYAWGFRNPWRWSFDRATGKLWLGDVGESGYEEINVVERGGNYGWSVREGERCFPYDVRQCDSRDLVEPFYAYGRDQGCAIIGGFVYRGQAIPALQGRYVYGDFCSSEVRTLDARTDGTLQARPLANAGASITSFAEDQTGELYVINYEGALSRLDAVEPEEADDDVFPQRLSETGCVDPADPTRPAPGLIPYTLNAPFWSDNADKQRWIALPNGKTIDVDDDNWSLPKGSVAMKNFYLAERLIETRLLVRHRDGGWAGYSYAWDDSLSDAFYVAGGAVRNIDGQEWLYPSSAQCLRCHTEAAGFTLGLETAQLNGDAYYHGTGRSANQLATLNHIGIFRRSIGAPERLPDLVDPADPAASLNARARAYLHSNCAQCHQPGGPTRAAMDLRYAIRLDDTGLCGQPPIGSNLGVTNARLLVPGEPDRSLLLARMARRDLYRMPPLASSLVHHEGVELIRSWIGQLADCRDD